MDGGAIFGNLCTGCHTSGAGGAPTMTAAGMGARAGKGKDTLYKHAIEGFTGDAGHMPAKGGNPALTDEQVKATVDWMLANMQVSGAALAAIAQDERRLRAAFSFPDFPRRQLRPAASFAP